MRWRHRQYLVHRERDRRRSDRHHAGDDRSLRTHAGVAAHGPGLGERFAWRQLRRRRTWDICGISGYAADVQFQRPVASAHGPPTMSRLSMASTAISPLRECPRSEPSGAATGTLEGTTITLKNSASPFTLTSVDLGLAGQSVNNLNVDLDPAASGDNVDVDRLRFSRQSSPTSSSLTAESSVHCWSPRRPGFDLRPSTSVRV